MLSLFFWGARVASAQLPCAAPSGLGSLSETETSAVLKWNSVANARTYEAQYKLREAATWQSRLISANQLELTGLEPGKTYQARVKTFCRNNGESVFSDALEFSTLQTPLWQINPEGNLYAPLTLLPSPGSARVGVGVRNPWGKLHVEGGAVIFTGAEGKIDFNRPGKAFLWSPENAALRVGEVNGTQWSAEKTGNNSIVLGNHSVASGAGSMALGSNLVASHPNSIAIGAAKAPAGENTVNRTGPLSHTISENSVSFIGDNFAFLDRNGEAVGLLRTGNSPLPGDLNQFGNLRCLSYINPNSNSLLLAGDLCVGGNACFGGEFLGANNFRLKHKIFFNKDCANSGMPSYYMGLEDPGNANRLGIGVFTGSAFFPVLSMFTNGNVSIGSPENEARLFVEKNITAPWKYNILSSVKGGAEIDRNQTKAIGVLNNGAEKLAIYGNGNIVSAGSLCAVEIWARLDPHIHPCVPDYVFEKDYALPPLSRVEEYIQKNKHLPEIPSEKEIYSQGLPLVDMNLLLLKKVEELYLYVIGLEKEIERLKAETQNTNQPQR